MRGFGLILSTGLAVFTAGPLLAQTLPLMPSMGEEVRALPFVTLDDTRLFSQSLYGKRLLADLDSNRKRLATENRRLEGELTARELALTQKRTQVSPSDFRALADVFNKDVQRHRAEQLTKEQDLFRQHEEDRQRFRIVANQILAEVMAERGALAVIAEEAILLGFRDIDITDAAVARLDERVGEGRDLTFEEVPPEEDQQKTLDENPKD